jgi:hypothetical protein
MSRHWGDTDRRILSPAKKLGIAPEEYERHRQAGEKWCWRCAEWRPLSEFHKHAGTNDGHATVCRDCKRTINRDQLPNRQRRRQRAA